jgi:uncharacterized protein (TIGR02453 family)
MAFFTKEYFKFFSELEKNNNKVWFDANRSRYEEFLKKPFKSFVEHIIAELAKDDDTIYREASKCIFRINKDIRFSKDKSPYKLHCAAVFGKGGTKDTRPGYFFHLGHKEIFIGGGMYSPSKEEIEKIRQEIYYNSDTLKAIVNKKDFKQLYGEIKGERNKVLPEDYKAFMKEQPYIANKQFYVVTSFSKEDVLANDFDKQLLKAFKVMAPLNAFLTQAISE